MFDDDKFFNNFDDDDEDTPGLGWDEDDMND